MRRRRRGWAKWAWCALAAVASIACNGEASPVSAEDDTGVRAFVETESNVVLITLDGVRYQELYRGADPALSGGDAGPAFPRLTAMAGREGRLYDAAIANPIHLSLPAYQSIFAGAAQPCAGNGCGQIRVETFPERLIDELGLPREKVASFASWANIAEAVEHRLGVTFVDAGPSSAAFGRDPASLALDGAEASLATPEARPDKLTMARALFYLERARPSFLYISLNDADEEAHRGHYDRYLATLRRDDQWIDELAARLDRMGEYGRRTALIITTDHGRGEGARFTDHGALSVGDADARIWMYLRLPRSGGFSFAAPAASRARPTHLDLRPTIEALYGLAPRTGPGRGVSLVARASRH